MGKFGVGNLAFGVVLNGDATLVMRRCFAVSCDVAEDPVRLAFGIYHRQAILILDQLAVIVRSPSLSPALGGGRRHGFGGRRKINPGDNAEWRCFPAWRKHGTFDGHDSTAFC